MHYCQVAELTTYFRKVLENIVSAENFQVQCDFNETLDSDIDDEPFATIKKAKLN